MHFDGITTPNAAGLDGPLDVRSQKPRKELLKETLARMKHSLPGAGLDRGRAKKEKKKRNRPVTRKSYMHLLSSSVFYTRSRDVGVTAFDPHYLDGANYVKVCEGSSMRYICNVHLDAPLLSITGWWAVV